MKEKHTLFLGHSEAGIFAQALFGSSGCFEKTAGAPPFSDWETGERLRKYIETITKDDRKNNVFVLVNALGAGEYFGSNINADWFGWDALSHEGMDYGYKTFLNAHAFAHHANKDPARAFGVPVVSVLNHGMRRVELVIKLSREAAQTQGVSSILARIDSGEFPDVSMGCKVPFDVCSIIGCEHKSKTRDDYCQHMRPPAEMRGIWGPNKILPDGQKIFVRNTLPRFFDISFVFIGADKTAKTMAKLAARGNELCFGNVCAIPGSVSVQVPLLYDAFGGELELQKAASACDGRRGPCGRLCADCVERESCETDKLAAAFGVKTAQHKKMSEIVKKVPVSHFSMRKLPDLEKGEPDLDEETLESLSDKPLRRALGGALRSGIVLKPHEYQHLVLRRMGEDKLLSRLDREHKIFRHSREFDYGGLADVDDPLDEVFALLKKYIRERTALGRPFQVRVLLGVGKAKNALPTRTPIGHSLLDKVSAAYNGYRRAVLKKLSQVVAVVREDPKLRTELLGDDVAMMFKTASSEIVSLDSMQYLLGAHLQDRDLLCSDPAAGAAVQDHSDLFREIRTPA